MSDDDFKLLKNIDVPPASTDARQRALDGSLLAFDQAQQENSAKASQGSALRRRLMSIVPSLKGIWTMDTRRLVPAGTAVLALLVLLPLGYRLYSSTALTPPPPLGVVAAPTEPPVSNGKPTAATSVRTSTTQNSRATTGTDTAVLSKQTAAPAGAVAQPQVAAAASQPATQVVGGIAPKEAVVPAAEDSNESDQVGDGEGLADLAPVPALAPGATNAAVPVSAPEPAMARATTPESISPISPQQATAVSGDTFQKFAESPLKAVATDPVSTFSIDVDTASYSYVRRALNEGRIPEPDAVRIEEMINYFPYTYPAAPRADVPFKPTIAVFPTPWNNKTELMQIGVRGYDPPAAARKPANLVFLIDTSGSMDEPDKLPLLQRALGLLVNTLPPEDTVSIVSYAGAAGVVLEPTSARDKAKILSALDNLSAGGSTAGAEGIELAYQLAEAHKIDGNNRVILATDGDFNVGISDPDALKDFIKQKRQSGISLSVLGFGEGDLDDATMQALAQNGDGNASYIDTLSEAQKVLVKEAGSTLDTIAKDVKIQVEFNPATVSAYRLIGYETRALNREDFNNDAVDAGDVGAGHTVTALYEITPVGAGGVPPVDPLRYGSPTATTAPAAAGVSTELADFKLRYKLPGSDTSKLIEQPVTPSMVVTDIAKASDDARWATAVAAFGQKLKGSDYAGTISYDQIAKLAAGARGVDPDGYRAEFIRLVGLADGLSGGSPQQPEMPDAAPLPPIVN
jgi:Ca-activated chloride channel homolog